MREPVSVPTELCRADREVSRWEALGLKLIGVATALHDGTHGTHTAHTTRDCHPCAMSQPSRTDGLTVSKPRLARLAPKARRRLDHARTLSGALGSLPSFNTDDLVRGGCVSPLTASRNAAVRTMLEVVPREFELDALTLSQEGYRDDALSHKDAGVDLSRDVQELRDFAERTIQMRPAAMRRRSFTDGPGTAPRSRGSPGQGTTGAGTAGAAAAKQQQQRPARPASAMAALRHSASAPAARTGGGRLGGGAAGGGAGAGTGTGAGDRRVGAGKRGPGGRTDIENASSNGRTGSSRRGDGGKGWRTVKSTGPSVGGSGGARGNKTTAGRGKGGKAGAAGGGETAAAAGGKGGKTKGGKPTAGKKGRSAGGKARTSRVRSRSRRRKREKRVFVPAYETPAERREAQRLRSEANERKRRTVLERKEAQEQSTAMRKEASSTDLRKERMLLGRMEEERQRRWLMLIQLAVASQHAHVLHKMQVRKEGRVVWCVITRRIVVCYRCDTSTINMSYYPIH